jgi:Flp pilus assembly protein TadG
MLSIARLTLGKQPDALNRATGTRTKTRAPLRGQSLVEFALIAPVFLMLVFGIIGFGLLFGWKHTLNNGAREGARAAAVCKSDEEVRAIVLKKTSSLSQGSSVNVSVTAEADDGTPLAAGQRQRGGSVTVTVSYVAPFIGIPGVMAEQKTLVSSSTFRMECDTAAAP